MRKYNIYWKASSILGLSLFTACVSTSENNDKPDLQKQKFNQTYCQKLPKELRPKPNILSPKDNAFFSLKETVDQFQPPLSWDEKETEQLTALETLVEQQDPTHLSQFFGANKELMQFIKNHQAKFHKISNESYSSVCQVPLAGLGTNIDKKYKISALMGSDIFKFMYVNVLSTFSQGEPDQAFKYLSALMKFSDRMMECEGGYIHALVGVTIHLKIAQLISFLAKQEDYKGAVLALTKQFPSKETFINRIQNSLNNDICYTEFIPLIRLDQTIKNNPQLPVLPAPGFLDNMKFPELTKEQREQFFDLSRTIKDRTYYHSQVQLFLSSGGNEKYKQAANEYLSNLKQRVEKSVGILKENQDEKTLAEVLDQHPNLGGDILQIIYSSKMIESIASSLNKIELATKTLALFK